MITLTEIEWNTTIKTFELSLFLREEVLQIVIRVLSKIHSHQTKMVSSYGVFISVFIFMIHKIVRQLLTFNLHMVQPWVSFTVREGVETAGSFLVT